MGILRSWPYRQAVSLAGNQRCNSVSLPYQLNQRDDLLLFLAIALDVTLGRLQAAVTREPLHIPQRPPYLHNVLGGGGDEG